MLVCVYNVQFYAGHLCSGGALCGRTLSLKPRFRQRISMALCVSQTGHAWRRYGNISTLPQKPRTHDLHVSDWLCR